MSPVGTPWAQWKMSQDAGGLKGTEVSPGEVEHSGSEGRRGETSRGEKESKYV